MFSAEPPINYSSLIFLPCARFVIFPEDVKKQTKENYKKYCLGQRKLKCDPSVCFVEGDAIYLCGGILSCVYMGQVN